MKKAAEWFLATSCSALEYLEDRGELVDEAEAKVSIVDSIRYTSTKRVPHYDVVIDGELVRVTAKSLGKAPEKLLDKIGYNIDEEGGVATIGVP